MKQVMFLFLFLCVVNYVHGQQRGITLILKEGNKREYLAEHRRIKIKFQNGKKIAGQFVITDHNTIMIKGNEISLDSVVKIRKASTFTAITTPIAITTGSLLSSAGIAILSSGSFLASIGIVPLVYGAVLVIVPLTVKKHSSEKWRYEIEN